jgi:branched-chain amino acid transport system substrate-binding protein
MRMTYRTALLAAAIGASTAFVAPAVAQDTLNLPNFSYRTGPFATSGIPLANGQLDYLSMLNERDGGLNGVKLNGEECETGYNTEKGVECYEKYKANTLVIQPWSTGITLQVLPKANVDKVPVFAAGYGFSAMQDGQTFQWAFNPPSSYWDGASILLNTIADGNLDNLKGKKVALLHLDHPYGKEPIPLLEEYAKKHGFTLLPIPVGLKEMQNQSAQWLQIRREKPDFVLMWGWGAMNGGALTEAAKTGYPMNQFLGIWWAGHDADLKLVGEKGKGYRSVSFSFPNSQSKVMQDVKKLVVDAGKSKIDAAAGEFDSVFYQRGIVLSAIMVEAASAAQKNFNAKTLNAEQFRWGLQNVKLTPERIAEIGLDGMVVPFSTSCADHTGHGGGWILEWDGAKFVKASEDIKQADRATIDALVTVKAKEYADANQPWSAQTCQ